MKLVIQRVLGTVAIAGGLYLFYAAFWVFSTVVWSQSKTWGWSVRGSSMILNHEWRGNEIYLLVLLYLVVGSALVGAGLLGWRGSRRHAHKKTSR
ncbi:MAG: hypothetical protein WBP10_06405 [Thermoanaerobaculia bacterium]|jgi:hypothetical protein